MRSESDWDGYVRRSKSAYGSSVEFKIWLSRNRPDLCVPESECVLRDSGIGWCPEDETPPAPGQECKRCHGVTSEGTRLVCPKCLLSGFERELHEQRLLAGVPEADPKVPEGKGGLG